MNSQDFENQNLSSSPGVYFFKQGEDILYIGRATSLRDRVRSYFSDDLIKTRGSRIVDMVSKSSIVKCQETNSVLEAIILEAELIKKHQPKANTEGKDDKSFNCVIFTKENYPQVLVMRKKDISEKLKAQSLKLSASFGPYPNGGLLKDALKIIRRIFPFRDSKCDPGQGKPCFNRQIGLCPGVCTGEISKNEYAKVIQRLKLFFGGKSDRLAKSIAKDMRMYAKKQEFEKANELKRTLFALKHIQDVGLIGRAGEELTQNQNQSQETFRIEAYDVAHLGGKNMVGVMVVSLNGELKKSDYRLFNVKGFTESNDPGALKEIISRRMKHAEWRMPDTVVMDGNEVQRKIGEILFGKIPVVAVTKDSRHHSLKIIGDSSIVTKYERHILKLNAEAHRFAISHHRKKARRALIA